MSHRDEAAGGPGVSPGPAPASDTTPDADADADADATVEERIADTDGAAPAAARGGDGDESSPPPPPGGAGDDDGENEGSNRARAVAEAGISTEVLAAERARAAEYLALAQRTQADFENYRKRIAREASLAEMRGAGRVARELLPALDNLALALDAADGEGEGHGHLAQGIRLVQSELHAALRRVGIEPFSPEGERFDPALHEAMASQPAEDVEPGTVLEVYQRGYRHNDTVLRPARVVVSAAAG